MIGRGPRRRGALLYRLRSSMMAPMTNTIRAKLNKTISIVAMTKAITSYLLALYTRTTSVITLLGEPLCREQGDFF
jgi:hypothetical protein